MNWNIVKLVLAREVRDQLRDRRTLFMIAVLPVLLYPVLGMSFFQITQFMREKAAHVLVIGVPDSQQLPPLVDGERFAKRLFGNPESSELLLLNIAPATDNDEHGVNPPVDYALLLEQARQTMQRDGYDVVVYFPPGFGERFAEYRRWLVTTDERPAAPSLPNVEVFPNLAKETSQSAYHRVWDVLSRWREEIGRQNLADNRIEASAARPFDIATRDVAVEGQHRAAIWSKILPFVLLIWALTGAFYPAVDLCAGEKERGTLETLLASPAERHDIVWGKLLTVIVFSMSTAMLNLVSLVVTGSLVLSQMPNLGPPPALASVWLLMALVPLSTLFSALSLALAAFARSTKEGQYYLMPLVLVVMPLAILPLAPGVELNFGTSLIPLTGVMLVLRSVLEGEYLTVLPYLPMVAAITLGCSWLAIRWATAQFNSEAVLFREGERWDVRSWMAHLWRERDLTPTFGQAICCGVVILLVRFFFNFAVPSPESFNGLVVLALVTQLVVVAAPAIFMAFVLTRSPGTTLLIGRPRWSTCLAAVLLAFTLHPLVNLLQTVIHRVYPLDAHVAEMLDRLVADQGSLWISLAALAILPAICEELAYRGFILTGLLKSDRTWTAIAIASIFFAMAHALFQQSLVAFVLGLVLGFLAVRARSLLPCVLFHVTHNGLALAVHQFTTESGELQPWLAWLTRQTVGGPLYRYEVDVLGLAISLILLAWFGRLSHDQRESETLIAPVKREPESVLVG